MLDGVLVVLGIALRQGADGGEAEAEQDLCLIRRIALKIPPEIACLGKAEQRVVGQCEVINADGAIVAGQQQALRRRGLGPEGPGPRRRWEESRVWKEWVCACRYGG